MCVGPAGRGCRIHRLHLCRGEKDSPKQSDGEALVNLEHLEMQSSPLLPSLSGPEW